MFRACSGASSLSCLAIFEHAIMDITFSSIFLILLAVAVIALLLARVL